MVKPDEVRQMPGQCMIEPCLPNNYDTVTISYTFFELGGDSVAGAGGKANQS